MRILIAEDSQTQAAELRRRLVAMGHEVVVTVNGAQAWSHLQSKPEPLLISDWMMPEMNGLELCRKIRTELKSSYVYVILLTSKTHRHERLQGLSAGADDFLAKPIDSCELEIALRTAQRIIAAQEALQTRARELELANERLSRLTSHDELTGLSNRRGFQEALDTACRHALVDHLPLSLIRLELDHLQQVLADLEPRGWEELLIKLANLLREESRECDIPARISQYGFALILPGVSSECALSVADILRSSLIERASTELKITASVGVAAMSAENHLTSSNQLLELAEQAVNQAHAEGGNRVVQVDPSIEEPAVASATETNLSPAR
jgi:two-component system chemotaxis response regulator CheY